jgi:hypothetical protein
MHETASRYVLEIIFYYNGGGAGAFFNKKIYDISLMA